MNREVVALSGDHRALLELARALRQFPEWIISKPLLSHIMRLRWTLLAVLSVDTLVRIVSSHSCQHGAEGEVRTLICRGESPADQFKD